jgi:hypothetical protein
VATHLRRQSSLFCDGRRKTQKRVFSGSKFLNWLQNYLSGAVRVAHASAKDKTIKDKVRLDGDAFFKAVALISGGKKKSPVASPYRKTVFWPNQFI